MPYAEFGADIESKEDYKQFWERCCNIQLLCQQEYGAPVVIQNCFRRRDFRIMLCLKAVLASRKGMPAMILDEIDSGVSGSIADKMGDL